MALLEETGESVRIPIWFPGSDRSHTQIGRGTTALFMQVGTIPKVTGTPRWLWDTPIAHRGWHDAAVDENSPTAFERAAAAGFAVEMDVQLGVDDLVILHDAQTGRVCGEDLAAAELTRSSRERLRFLRSGDPVITLQDALDIVGGRVPVVIEMKDPGDRLQQYEIVSRVTRLVQNYVSQGHEAAVHSFEPRLVRLTAKYAPALVRGQVAGAQELTPLQRAAAENYLTAPVAQPVFIAHNVQRLPSMRVANLRNAGLPVIAWTVNTAEDLQVAAQYADNVLVEGEALEMVLAAGDFNALKVPPGKMRERFKKALAARKQ